MASDILRGTVALVTGASSGIGAATAQALAGHGAAVAVLARRRDRLTTLADQIRDQGAPAPLVIEADITDAAQARAAIAQTVATLGRLDTLINNAGVMLNGPALDAPAEEWDQMLAVNLHGLLHTTRAALPHLVDAARQAPRTVADLVTISSTAGRVARPSAAVYSATKFGANAFSESLRQELQPHRVRVGVVEPGTVDTDLATHQRTDIRDSTARLLDGLELLHPTDIADAVTYIVTRPRHVAVNEILVRAADQTW